jgi:hypothetical protein
LDWKIRVKKKKGFLDSSLNEREWSAGVIGAGGEDGGDAAEMSDN